MRTIVSQIEVGNAIGETFKLKIKKLGKRIVKLVDLDGKQSEL